MNALSLKHVYKRYGDFQIRDLCLELPQGCVMGLVGENGAGKSTTIRMILDMTKPDSGEIAVLGQEHGKQFHQVKEEIGVVLDEPGFPDCLSAEQIGHIMAGVFQHWDKEIFKKYNKAFALPSHKTIKEYSRGMKMKLAIAVALSHRAKLLLLDEATSGLDPVVRDEILDIFFEFTRQADCSILMSSHIVSDLEKLCDYIAFLHKGELLVCEEKDALLERYGLIRCSREQLAALDARTIRGKKETPYGIEALVERKMVPAGIKVSSVGIEELFIYLTKEAG